MNTLSLSIESPEKTMDVFTRVDGGSGGYKRSSRPSAEDKIGFDKSPGNSAGRPETVSAQPAKSAATRPFSSTGYRRPLRSSNAAKQGQPTPILSARLSLQISRGTQLPASVWGGITVDGPGTRAAAKQPLDPAPVLRDEGKGFTPVTPRPVRPATANAALGRQSRIHSPLEYTPGRSTGSHTKGTLHSQNRLFRNDRSRHQTDEVHRMDASDFVNKLSHPKPEFSGVSTMGMGSRYTPKPRIVLSGSQPKLQLKRSQSNSSNYSGKQLHRPSSSGPSAGEPSPSTRARKFVSRTRECSGVKDDEETGGKEAFNLDSTETSVTDTSAAEQAEIRLKRLIAEARTSRLAKKNLRKKVPLNTELVITEMRQENWLRARGLGNRMIDYFERKRLLRQWFDSLDEDKSGEISIDELETPLMNAGVVTSREELKKMIDGYDDNGNGTLDFEEFCAMLSADNHDTKTKALWELMDMHMQGRLGDSHLPFSTVVAMFSRKVVLAAVMGDTVPVEGGEKTLARDTVAYQRISEAWMNKQNKSKKLDGSHKGVLS